MKKLCNMLGIVFVNKASFFETEVFAQDEGCQRAEELVDGRGKRNFLLKECVSHKPFGIFFECTITAELCVCGGFESSDCHA